MSLPQPFALALEDLRWQECADVLSAFCGTHSNGNCRAEYNAANTAREIETARAVAAGEAIKGWVDVRLTYTYIYVHVTCANSDCGLLFAKVHVFVFGEHLARRHTKMPKGQ